MHVFVSASTECFRDLSLVKAMERLADLEYTAVEFAMFEDGEQLKPSEVLADVEAAVNATMDAFGRQHTAGQRSQRPPVPRH